MIAVPKTDISGFPRKFRGTIVGHIPGSVGVTDLTGERSAQNMPKVLVRRGSVVETYAFGGSVSPNCIEKHHEFTESAPGVLHKIECKH